MTLATHFTKLTPKRKFGVELEIIATPNLKTGACPYIENTAIILQSAGIKAKAAGYGHGKSSSWKVTTDSSLNFGGLEIVSPILEGEEGLEEVAKVCRILTANNYTVDRSCGLHVHIDAREFDRVGLFRVIRQFLAEEPNFDRMVASHRIGANYCYSNLYYFGGNLKNAHSRISYSAQHIAKLFGVNNRYLKLNIQSLWRHHTIEFRQHEGSIDHNKVTSWIRLVGLFTDAALLCKNERYEDMMAKVAPSTCTRSQMIEHFAKMASRKGKRRKMKGGCREPLTRTGASQSVLTSEVSF